MPEDLYALLGVAHDADEAELRSAFRRLAKEAHPDHGGDAARFQELHQAYEVLRDPESRASYDRRLKMASDLGDSAGAGGAAGASRPSTGPSAGGGYAGGSLAAAVVELGRLEALVGALSRLCAMPGAPEMTRAELAAAVQALERARAQVRQMSAAAGLDPDSLLGGTAAWTGRSSAPAWAEPEQPALVYTWGDGRELRITGTNAHGAVVPDEEVRRSFEMGPRFVCERLRPGDRVLQLCPPARFERDASKELGRMLLVGPRWLVPGGWVAGAALVASCFLGAVALATTGGGSARLTPGAWLVLSALLAAWWPVRLGLRAVSLRWPARVSAPVWGAVLGAVGSLPWLVARGPVTLIVGVLAGSAVGAAAGFSGVFAHLVGVTQRAGERLRARLPHRRRAADD